MKCLDSLGVIARLQGFVLSVRYCEPKTFTLHVRKAIEGVRDAVTCTYRTDYYEWVLSRDDKPVISFTNRADLRTYLLVNAS